MAAGQSVSVDRFLEIVLQAVQQRFHTTPAEIASDQPPPGGHFRSMPARAVWAAAVFWYALEKAQYGRGFSETLKEMRPAKVRLIAAKLAEVKRPLLGIEGNGERWVQAFLAEAATLRNIAATMRVREPDGREITVPLHLIESRPSLSAAPVSVDAGGDYVLLLDRKLEIILEAETKQFREARQTILLPSGQETTVAAREAAQEAIRAMERLKRDAGLSKREETRLDAAITLVRLSGLIPSPTGFGMASDQAPAEATVIL